MFASEVAEDVCWVVGKRYGRRQQGAKRAHIDSIFWLSYRKVIQVPRVFVVAAVVVVVSVLLFVCWVVELSSSTPI